MSVNKKVKVEVEDYEDNLQPVKFEEDDDEDDYMSDAILAQCTSSKSKDVAPIIKFNGLHSTQKEAKITSQPVILSKIEKLKQARIRDGESIQFGLHKQIGSDNKGFQLLSKMGYKPGSCLGKRRAEDEEDRLKEPIPLELKWDRVGLGQKTKDVEKLAAATKRQEELANPEEFRQRSYDGARRRTLEYDLKTAQAACSQLDGRVEKEPIEDWYWPIVPKEEPSEDDDKPKKSKLALEIEKEEEQEIVYPPTEEMLSSITEYLRTEYLYCIWCGTSYDSPEDYEASCPGQTRDVH